MWLIYSLAASLFWGLTYVLNERVYKHISFLTSLVITSFFAFVTLGLVSYFTRNLQKDLHTIVSSEAVLWLVGGGVVTLIVAEVFIGLSISSKNATLSGLIEISYPIFIALFSYLLFKENQLTLPTGIGASLIFIGIAVIYFFNK
ncbi:MAG: EamA family transporter [Candidatus Vogelbacteria bacterium]|nr:EamA family transporter [Candidatus Vogelbacteria bacterium]